MGPGAGGQSSGGPATPTPSISCGDGGEIPPLPTSFALNCAACHNEFGAQNAQFPDLFQYTGSLEEFLAKVRSGGDLMPTYAEDRISAADAEAMFAYFQGGIAGASLDCGSDGPLIAELDTCSGETVEISPLFGVPTPVEPLVSRAEDGTLVTRVAGRVRGRHELEETFSPYHARYFENRSFEIRIEDTVTEAGGGEVRFTYLPLSPVSDNGSPTNFRAWKIYGQGNVFHENQDMTEASLTELHHTIDRNHRDDRQLALGDLLEFEVGVFIAGQNPDDPGAIEGRTNYYTDTFRYQVGIGGLTAFSADTSGEIGPLDSAVLGGATTIPWIYAEPELYFSQMALNVSPENVQPFLEGRRLFHTHFDTGDHTENSCSTTDNAFICNPVFTEQAGKSGPLDTAAATLPGW
jgi:hypothetical protein